MRPRSSGLVQWLLFVVLALGLGGCAGLSGILRDTPDLAKPPESPPPAETRAEAPEPPALAAQPAEPGPAAEAPGDVVNAADLSTERTDTGQVQAVLAAGVGPQDGLPQFTLAAEGDKVDLAQRPSGGPPPDVQIEEYDPWEPFNEKTFEFNRWLDRWILKPVAKGYRKVVPDLFQEMIGNGFDNIRVVPRFVNCLLQGKVVGAGREVGRLVINSTLGIGGLFDPAMKEFGIKKCNEDAGQTFGVWGIGPGPYLVLPFLPPLTVRDAIGYAIDQAMDPLAYFVPFIWERLSMKVEDTVNDRALNIDLYQGFEEATVEFYSALRNAYLQRRQKLIQE